MSSQDTDPLKKIVTLTENSSVKTNSIEGTSKILMLLERAVETHFHVQHGTEPAPVILSEHEETSWLLLPLAIRCHSATRIHLFLNLYVTGQLSKNQKRISTNIIHSYHLCSSPKANLNWSNDSDSVLRNSIRKVGVKSWSM